MYTHDTDLTELTETRAAVAELLHSLNDLSGSDRGTACLELAAELVEAAAYDLAGTETAPRVARLILMSAELARIAETARSDMKLARAC